MLAPSLTFADAASAVADLAHDLRLRRIDLLGVRFGAAVALELGAARADLVRRLVLVGVPAMDRLPPAKQESIVLRSKLGTAQDSQWTRGVLPNVRFVELADNPADLFDTDPEVAGEANQCFSRRIGRTGCVRLNKYISETGVCSRREADKWIEAGRVTCNGIRAVSDSRSPMEMKCESTGSSSAPRTRRSTLHSTNRSGITCTTEPQIKDNILDLIGHSERIFPIGRLDKDSEGLILLTNDGDIVNEILRAENNHEKEYVVTVNRPITDLALAMMASGVKIMGEMTKPCKVTRIDAGNVSHDPHSRAQSADPPHVLGARLQDAATAARAHHRC